MTASTKEWWEPYKVLGAVLLGAGAKPPDDKSITKEKKARFSQLDKIVTKAAKSFVDAGLALREIKDDKLYLAKYDTFEEYCQSVLNISRQYANNLVRAGRAVETIVSKEGLPAPENEAQVRELLRVPIKERANFYRNILESVDGDPSQLTAARIREEVETGQFIKPKPNRVTPTEKIEKAIELTEKIEAALAQGKSVKRLLTQLKKALGE